MQTNRDAKQDERMSGNDSTISDMPPSSALFVCYGYPPISSPGSLRMTKYTEHLSENGWRPIVLTVDRGYNPGKPFPVPQDDRIIIERVADVDPIKALAKRERALEDGEGRSSRGVFSKGKKLYRSIAFPDRDWFWIPGAVIAGRQLIQRQDLNISMIFSSSPTISNHIVAMLLARYSGLPWVAEFRDLWSAPESMRQPTNPLRSTMERRLERQICREADHLVTISQEYQQNFAARHDVPVSHTSVIYNGFDPKDFEGIVRKAKFPKFTIAHAGSFYDGARNPVVLFKALRTLVDGGEIDLEKVELNFYGVDDAVVQETSKALGLDAIVKWHGTVPYHDVLQQLCNSYCLLAVTHRGYSHIAMKIFDYIGCGRPVIAISPLSGTFEKIVVNTGIGAVVDHDDERGMQQMLRRYWQQWKLGNTTPMRPSKSEIALYTRPFQAAQLAGVFELVTSKATRATR